MESRMRRAIERFEPRIVTRTLQVRADLHEGSQRSPSLISFEISGEFCPLPVPEALYVKTEMDLETGSFNVSANG
jgi:type VI secretion system protein ImpF